MLFCPPPFMRAKQTVDITATASAYAGSASTHNLGSLAIGAAASDRVVLFELQANTGAAAGVTVTSVTINGAPATLVATVSVGGAGETYISAIYALAVPTGTTATFSVSFSASVQMGYTVCRMVGNGASTTPHATATDTSSPFSQALAIPARGGAIGVGGGFRSGGVGMATWTGLDEVTDSDLANANNRYSTALINSEAGQSSNIDLAWSGGAPTFGSMVLASFAPG